MHFIYGNLFHKNKISLLTEVSSTVGISNGTDISKKKLLEQYEIWKTDFAKYFNSPVTINLIFYWNNCAYLDIHVLETQNESHIYSKKIGLSRTLQDKWDKYQLSLEAAMSNGEGSQTFEAGHWISQNKNARAFEMEFIKTVDDHFDELEDILKNSDKYESRAAAAYLLHWSHQKERVFDILTLQLEYDPEHLVHNNIVRALSALCQIVQLSTINAKTILDLIFHKSSLCINKGLMFVVNIHPQQPDVFLNLLSNKHYRDRIEILTNAIQPHLSEPAQKVLELKKIAYK